jgi:hypothetical protein
MESEKRRGARKTFNRTIVLEKSDIVSDHVRHYRFDGVVLDVSQGGLGLSTDRSLREGEIVKLFLPLNQMNITVPVMAEVKWSRRMSSACQSGLRFLT